MRVNLNDTTAQRLIALQEYYGFSTLTHLVNVLVSKEFENMTNNAQLKEVSDETTPHSKDLQTL